AKTLCFTFINLTPPGIASVLCHTNFVVSKLQGTVIEDVKEFDGVTSPPGRGRREAAGEGHKSMQILRTPPYPPPTREGESHPTLIHSHFDRPPLQKT